MTDYREIFNKVESTLIRVGSANLSEEKVRANLNAFKEFATRTLNDNDYFDILVYVPFYSGFNAETVTSKLGTIRRHLSDYRTVAKYDATKLAEIASDPEMIRNKRKIKACADNARTFQAIVDKYGSFQNYIDSFGPKLSLENLARLRDDLRRRFRYLGKITVYHFLTDIGMPVLKPDRVMRRIFYRLGLIDSEREDEDQILKAVAQGQQFAQALNCPIRYIDIVFVAYGQVQSSGFGIEQGICLSERPRCNICGVSEYCQYFSRNVQSRPNQGTVQP